MNTARPTRSAPDDTMPQRVVRVGIQGEGHHRREPVRLSDLVTWSSAAPGRMLGVVQWAQRGTAKASSLMVGRPPSTPGQDTDPILDLSTPAADFAILEIVHERSLEPRMGGGPRLHLSLAGAGIVRGPQRRTLVLTDLWVDTAAPVPGQVGARKAPETVWEMVVSGADVELLVRGPWLHVAALGMLAGWPEPA